MIELISLHIPKTAGTTFKAVLQGVYPADTLLLDYDDRIGNPESRFRSDFDGWKRDNENAIAHLPAVARAIHGHFWAGKYFSFFPGAKKVVWLREPARQLISAYHYWKAGPLTPNPLKRLLHEKNLSLLEFARLEGLQNPVSNLFLRGYGIDDFDFIGIQEFFPEDLAALSGVMDWPLVPVPVVNATENADYLRFAFDDDVIAELRALNQADVHLYEEALRRRSSRLARIDL